MQFSTSCSPFLPANTSVHRVMRQVLIALIPAFTAMFWLFGYTVLLQLLLASSTALLAEVICLRLRKRPVKIHLMDLSALVSAVLLALAIPTIAPWWVSTCGALFAIIIGKQVYGGLGYNPFNPAMTGYVFLLISFPQQMTAWQAPDIFISLADALHVIFSGTATIDGLSSATLLDSIKTAGASTALLTEIPSTSTGLLAGAGWELISMAYLLGGLWLLYRKVISWHIPVAVLLGIFMPAGINFFLDANAASSPVFHLFSGASLCGAFFIATDPVSAATSNTGRLIYGGLIGLLSYIIRYWGGYPDGIAFAVLLANLAAPSIDYYLRPKPVNQPL
ncbi:MAG TPA: RnfABCDGE type electron transport complex subunit D [Methyloprofundus sp.]|uniref:RnfABCDGE type electron transport complex subunit D n=1 Tax=Methyloprofundus sp. TaxID=2020875 RepID=UPI0017DA2BB9|nr:RnfABCDGE type electron transport complex subunit D [Methyloprofundus sp.]HIG64415.1 RnfABCDGE type electron transport complex subunit D [Methyloprofundus sp.]HIL79236.1 RnfABCDGE type electron transport complex subunit D [Methylococcales bacterium]